MGALRAIMGNRDLVRLEAAWGWVSLVRWALAILVGLYAYDVAGSTGVGVAALARMAPASLLAPRLSVLVDRHSRRLVLIWSLVARVGLAAVMAWAVWVEAPLGVVLVAAGGYGLAECLQRPAQAALLGVHARNPSQLAAANSIWSMLDNLGFVVGSLMVGGLAALAGTRTAFLVCVVPLLLACVAAARLTADVPPPPLDDEDDHPQARTGRAAVLGDRRLVLLLVVLAVDMFVQAVLDVLIVVAALDLLDMGDEGAGWLSAAWGIGGVLGGAVAAMLARGRLRVALVGGLLLAGLPLVALAGWPEQLVALLVMAAIGLGLGAVEVALLTLTQRLVPADLLGRVYGVQETVTSVAMAVGSVAAAGLVALTGVTGALFAVAGLLPLMALVVLARGRDLDDGAETDEALVEVLRSVPAFSALPMATVETLAQRVGRAEAAADEVVVRQGEPGSTFYVIAEGSVEVTEDGVFKRVEHAGDCFGEIALLHQVPRTATVRAVEPTRLLVLEQEEFLAAVGAHPRTRHVLRELASERLRSPRPT